MAEGTHAGARITRMPRASGPTARLDVVRTRLSESGLAPKTVRAYMVHVGHAEAWATSEGLDLRTIRAADLARYVALRPNTHPTRRQMHSALGHYWRVLKRRNPPLWVVRVPKKPRMICRAVDDAEAAEVAMRARAVGGNPGVATLLALYTALRREEIAKLRWDGIDDEGWVTFIGKGDQPASLPLHPIVREVLAELPRLGPYVFPGKVDGHVHPSTVWGWIKDLTGRPPHIWRHTCLAKANDETGDLRATQEYARHARPETTAGYTRATKRRLVGVMNAIDYGDAA